MSSDTTLLDAAVRCRGFGWSVFPLQPGTKMPAVKTWKPFQTMRPSEDQLHQWFAGKRDSGIAVVLGPVAARQPRITTSARSRCSHDGW